MKKVDKMSCLFLLVFFSVFGGIVVGFYLAAGVIDVPPESPLADLDYTIQPLADVSLPRDAIIPPGTVTPVNQLYGGKNWLPIIIIWATLLIVTSIITARRNGDSVFVSLGGWTCTALLALKNVAETLAKVPFYYSHLRSSAQTLINGSHRWRVILAYIELWCVKYDTYAYAVATSVLLIVFLVGVTLASLAAYAYWKSTTAKNRPF